MSIIKGYTMRENVVYNDAENLIYIRSLGDKIFIVCNDDDQVDKVQSHFHKAGNVMLEFEEWDEGDDKKYILTFKVGENVEQIFN